MNHVASLWHSRHRFPHFSAEYFWVSEVSQISQCVSQDADQGPRHTWQGPHHLVRLCHVVSYDVICDYQGYSFFSVAGLFELLSHACMKSSQLIVQNLDLDISRYYESKSPQLYESIMELYGLYIIAVRLWSKS